MRLPLFIIPLFILSLFVPFNTIAQEKGVIYWQTYHRPPGSIKVGPYKNQGFVDKVLALIISKMTDYEHEMPSASLARAIMDIRMGKNACHPALHVSDERKQHMYFSQPAMINPMNRIIGHRSELDMAAVAGTLPATAFTRDNTFALIKGRRYAGGYDEFIDEYINKDKIVYIPSETIKTLFQLVANKRVDYTIAYPFELEHFILNNPSVRADWVSYRLPQAPAYSVGSVACPKTAWGKEVIARVNEVLNEIKPTMAYQEAVTTWWEAERGTEQFTTYYNNVFLNRKPVQTQTPTKLP